MEDTLWLLSDMELTEPFRAIQEQEIKSPIKDSQERCNDKSSILKSKSSMALHVVLQEPAVQESCLIFLITYIKVALTERTF